MRSEREREFDMGVVCGLEKQEEARRSATALPEIFTWLGIYIKETMVSEWSRLLTISRMECIALTS